eukprot:366450-Chlamydomonas_euryale.AAC.10
MHDHAGDVCRDVKHKPLRRRHVFQHGIAMLVHAVPEGLGVAFAQPVPVPRDPLPRAAQAAAHAGRRRLGIGRPVRHRQEHELVEDERHRKYVQPPGVAVAVAGAIVVAAAAVATAINITVAAITAAITVAAVAAAVVQGTVDRVKAEGSVS